MSERYYALLLMVTGATVESQETREADPGEYRAGLSAGRVWEQDLGDKPDLDGYRIGFTAFSQGINATCGFAGSWFVEWKESYYQEVFEGGLELSF